MTENRHTNTVRIILHNYEPIYRAFQQTVRRAWWDDDDNTWNDIDKAAAELKQLTTALDAHADGMSDLLKVDYAQVDWAELVTDELEEINLSEDRPQLAGLPSDNN